MSVFSLLSHLSLPPSPSPSLARRRRLSPVCSTIHLPLQHVAAKTALKLVTQLALMAASVPPFPCSVLSDDSVVRVENYNACRGQLRMAEEDLQLVLADHGRDLRTDRPPSQPRTELVPSADPASTPLSRAQPFHILAVVPPPEGIGHKEKGRKVAKKRGERERQRDRHENASGEQLATAESRRRAIASI